MKKIVSLFLVLLMTASIYTAFAENWQCLSCGNSASDNFCSNCGTAKPSEKWTCSQCGNSASGNFCSNCGAANKTDEITAYEKWLNAHNSTESGEQYDQSLLAYDDLKEGYKSGRVGTNEYSAAKKYLLGDNEYDADAQKTLRRYLTSDGSGAANFQKDLIKYGFANANGSMMSGVTTQQIASEFGIGEELVSAMFMKMNEYIPEGASKYHLDDKDDGRD